MSKSSRPRGIRRAAVRAIGGLVRRLASVEATAYDAAKASRHLDRWWKTGADHNSANESNTREVRERLRNRARYEVANNSIANGIVHTLTNDVIGTGPRLQLVADGLEDRAGLRVLEQGWARYAKETGLVDDLRTLYMARVVDGEGLGVFESVGGVRRMRILEVDRLTSTLSTARNIDGVLLDERGMPTAYQIRRRHPGGPLASLEYDEYRPGQVIHFYRRERAEQIRGIPYITPALNLFAQLRRLTLATLSSAELAANVSAVIQSDAPAFEDEAGIPDAGDVFDIERGGILTLPWGYKIAQLKAEQPTTQYEQFKRALVSEIARCLNMPYNVAAGDSSSYNYASGRMDHQVYHRQLKIEHDSVERAILDRLLVNYLNDASVRTGTLPARVRTMLLGGDLSLSWQWHWPGREHVDPLKEANAASTRLSSGVSNLKIEYAKQGLDWEEEVRQTAREAELMADLGIAGMGLAHAEIGEDDEED